MPKLGFDPFDYNAKVRANPQDYITMSSIANDVAMIQKVKKAPTLAALKEAFQGPAKAAKTLGDTWLLEMLTKAAQKRKEELAR